MPDKLGHAAGYGASHPRRAVCQSIAGRLTLLPNHAKCRNPHHCSRGRDQHPYYKTMHQLPDVPHVGRFYTGL